MNNTATDTVSLSFLQAVREMLHEALERGSIGLFHIGVVEPTGHASWSLFVQDADGVVVGTENCFYGEPGSVVTIFLVDGDGAVRRFRSHEPGTGDESATTEETG